MSLPSAIVVHEVGPREGMQIEKGPIPTEDKIRLVDLLSECAFADIEVTSFVSPRRVPQMADAEAVVAGITRREGTQYTCVFLNQRGLERALAVGGLDVSGSVLVSASDVFSVKNMGRTTEEVLAGIPAHLAVARAAGVPIGYLSVLATFGCNFSGDVEISTVVDRIERALALADGEGMEIRTLLLADSMGWASPEQVRHTVGAIRERWPDHLLRLHLHDTRGMGLANAYAAMCEGVTEFDSSVAGLGGCPFGGDRGAAGNIATEDLVHMCAELGIETGVDLDRLLEVAHEAVGIVGHDLPGKVMKGGSLAAVRRGLQNRPNNGTC